MANARKTRPVVGLVLMLVFTIIFTMSSLIKALVLPKHPCFAGLWAGKGTRVWQWLALGIGLLAVGSGLVMPVAMLAADMRSGPLSNICTTVVPPVYSTALADSGLNAVDTNSAPATHLMEMPCDSCGFLAWLPWFLTASATAAPGLLAWFGTPGQANARLPRLGPVLPQSRAPPLFNF